ncbi:uncharacterized protein LOC134687958 [Mytilus trossulus]|uniref:uncharacterized protein LOC134687958 n=1 Tax=Mytilus trossulus TaxID=6551 RepID=UPI0030045565
MHKMQIGKFSIVNGILIAIFILNHNYAQTTPPGFGIYHPCVNHSVILSYSNRTINYTLQSGEHDDCEASYITAGWYRYEMFQNIPTKAPLPGQCGSSSPIWLNGTYPVIPYENHSILACKVGSSSNCEDSWNITVQNCLTFNIIYLEPVPSCGRYCMEPEWNYPSWIDPCFYNNTIITGDYTRTLDYILSEGMSEDCESSNLTAGWYRFDGYQNILTTPPSPGQCGSSSPIWLNGTYPDIPGMMAPMTACAVSYSSSCQESWPVKVLNCYSYNVAYLQPNGNCSKYCMDSVPYQMPTGLEHCYTATVIESTDDRTVEYDLMMNEMEKCDNITEGWYRFQENQNILNYPPSMGQCSSRSPIWLEGTYPTTFGETKTMKACMVSNYTNCENQGNVTVMNCNGYNVAYLTSFNGCGRICMESKDSFNDTTNQQSSTVHPSQSFIHNASVSQANLEASYTAPYSSFQPHATMVMSDTFSGEPVFTAPYSEYLPSETNHFYATASYEKTYSEHPSVDQLSSTESWSIQPTTVLDVTKSSSFPSTESTTPFNMYNQTTPPGNGYNHPCLFPSVIMSNSNRTINYTLQNGEHDDCESSYITAGWYRYELLQNIPTKPPLPGQCGSSSPIWLNGTYPVNINENHTMLACKVGNSSNCEDSWNVTVQNCLTFNVIYLEPVWSCGRYCMESERTYPSWHDPCFSNHTVMHGDYTRATYYVLSEGMTEDCESSNLTAGWYRYDGFQSIPTTPPSPGQCGSSSPIWLNGTYPDIPGMMSPMTACAVGNSSTCQESWPVKVLNCYSYNVVYLQPNGNCSRYCMDSQMPTGSEICDTATVIEATDDRTVDYDLMMNEMEKCDNITEGWYRFQDFKNILNYPPSIGQCSSRAPIWLEGTYPSMYTYTYGETTTMKACMVSNHTNCENQGNVTVMNCYSYNIAYLTPFNGCGRICKEQQNSFGSTPSTMNHPCHSKSVIEGTYDRTPNYVLQPGEVEYCDNITEGWYTFASGQNVPTTPPVPGQCGSRSPVWFDGTYPTSFEETTTMKACMVSNFTNCEDSWNVTVMHCYGYNVAYMKEINNCGRVCMEQQNSSGSTPPTTHHPCYSTSVIEGTYDRTPNYILQPGEVEYCDNITGGWYTFASGQNVPTTPPVPGQCGSRSPVWFDGTYPTSFEETTTMKACMVSNFTNCEDSWNVTVMHCYGYNVAYMKKLNDCGRVCMESNETFNETINQQSSTVYPSLSFIHNASVSQANLEASYTVSSSSFQPHATTVMSNTFSGEPIFTAPYSEYLPSETNHFYETASYEKTYSEHPSVDQFSNTESWNIQPTTVSDVTQSTSFPFTESTTPYDMYAQTTSPPGNGYYHPCVNHTLIISNFNRTINYTLQNGEHDDCESSYITAGWYRYEMLQNIPTKAPLPGQCGSSSPIWLNGTYSMNFNEYRSMLACQVGNSSICEKSWNVTVLSCMTFNVVYLEPVVSSCGRYCMEPERTYPSWYKPCFYDHTIISGDFTRTIDYVLSEGMTEDCESSNLTAGWYRYDGFQSIPTTPPSPGQCGSSSPIWLNGSISYI